MYVVAFSLSFSVTNKYPAQLEWLLGLFEYVYLPLFKHCTIYNYQLVKCVADPTRYTNHKQSNNSTNLFTFLHTYIYLHREWSFSHYFIWGCSAIWLQPTFFIARVGAHKRHWCPTSVFLAVGSSITWLILSWDKHNCCYFMSKLTFFSQNGQVRKKNPHFEWK